MTTTTMTTTRDTTVRRKRTVATAQNCIDALRGLTGKVREQGRAGCEPFRAPFLFDRLTYRTTHYLSLSLFRRSEKSITTNEKTHLLTEIVSRVAKKKVSAVVVAYELLHAGNDGGSDDERVRRSVPRSDVLFAKTMKMKSRYRRRDY